jgi:hypothetical protein
MHLAPWRRVARAILLPPLAAIFLVEDLLVRSFGAAMGVLTRLKLVARFEAWAKTLKPWQALLLFFLPVIIFLPVHLAAIWAFATRRAMLGIAIYIAGKLMATAVVGRILIVCRPALIQYRWFVRASGWVTRTRDRSQDGGAATAVWRAYKAFKAGIHAFTARFRGGAGWWSAFRRMARRKAV